MAVYLNTAALAAIRLRSDALGPIDSIGHPLVPGKYMGTVWRGHERQGTFVLDVTEAGDGEQVEVDLAAVGRPRNQGGQASFRMGARDRQPVFVVFHCEGDRGGYRVVLSLEGKRKPVFDSTTLGPGDYYMLTPLRPGDWTMRTGKSGKGTISVTQARPAPEPRASQNGAMIRTDGKSFTPAAVSVVSGDGVVFEITGADVAIEVAIDATKRRDGPRQIGVRVPGRTTTQPRPAEREAG